MKKTKKYYIFKEITVKNLSEARKNERKARIVKIEEADIPKSELTSAIGFEIEEDYNEYD